MRAVSGDQFEPRRQVIVEDVEKPLPHSPDHPLGVAQITMYEPNRVRVEASAEDDGVLVLTDTYYPGWRAWVDGAEQPILRANYLFRGIMLTVGQHTVEFWYWPHSFEWGLAIATATALLVLAYAVALWAVCTSLSVVLGYRKSNKG